MAGKRAISQEIQDLLTFEKIVQAIREQAGGGETARLSNVRLADRIGLLGPNRGALVRDCLERLADDFGATLVVSEERSNLKQLTPEGEEVFALAQALLADVRSIKQRFRRFGGEVRVGVSHFPLVSFLPEIINAYVQDCEESGRDPVRLKLEDIQDDFGEAMERLRKGEFDFVTAWALGSRVELIKADPRLGAIVVGRPPDTAWTDEFGPALLPEEAQPNKAFDEVVVFNSRAEDFCRRDALPFGHPDRKITPIELRDKLLFLLRYDDQVFDPRQSDGSGADGASGPGADFGEPQILSRYDEILEVVRLNFDGVAVVPGVYSVLDRDMRAGRLFYLPLARPSADGQGEEAFKFRLMSIFRRSGTAIKLSKTAAEFFREFRRLVAAALPQRPAWSFPLRDDPAAAQGPGFQCSAYQYAYFLSTAEIGRKPPIWRVGHLTWTDPRQVPKAKHPFDSALAQGRMAVTKRGGEGERREHVYEVVARLEHGRMLVLSGCQIEPEHNADDVFTATFSMADPDGRHAFGVWNGWDDAGYPLIAPMVLTRQRPRSIHDLRQLTQAAMIRSLVGLDIRAIEGG